MLQIDCRMPPSVHTLIWDDYDQNNIMVFCMKTGLFTSIQCYETSCFRARFCRKMFVQKVEGTSYITL